MSFQYNDRLVWPEGKRKAFTLSYDDGVEQDIRFIKLLDKYRIKATFNLNSNLSIQSSINPVFSRQIAY